MIRLTFWYDWPKPLIYILFSFGFLFVGSIILGLVYDAQGYNTILDWEIIGTRSLLPVEVKIVETGPFRFPLHVDNFFITETYRGSDIHINLVANYLYITITALAFVLGITASTYLERVWYIIISAIIILILVFCKFENLMIFGLSENIPLVLITLSYMGLSYIFNAVQPYRDFIERFKVFLGITILWAVIIYFFAEANQPFLLLGANAFLIPYLIGLFFILMVSHEIMYFVIVVLTRSQIKSGNNLTQFTLFSFIYLGNVLILYLHDTHVINWNFYYLNPYVLAAVSAVLGLWGLQSRKILYEGSVKHYPIFVFIYLAMGIFSFSSMFYFMGNSNDPILQVVKDAIIYSHLGFGFIFFIYIISNFMGMLRKNMKVTQVIYKPHNMPHFTFRFAGFIVVLALFLKENIEVPLNHTLSGMFNNNADYYKIAGNTVYADTFYEDGKLYGFMNHKSNYALGKIYESYGDFDEALEDYENATRARPSEKAYINWSRLEAILRNPVSSMMVLNQAQQFFPRSEAILNNKGYLFSNAFIVDSAFIYFDASYRSSKGPETPGTNYLALLAGIESQHDPDSIVQHYNLRDSKASITNLLLVRNQQNIRSPYENNFELDSVLNIYSSSYFINYLTNQYYYIDSSEMNAIETVAKDPSNNRYSESVIFSLAIANYMSGYVTKAVEQLRQLAILSSGNNGKYYFALGQLMMDMGDYQQAVDYFELAMSEGNTMAEYAMNVCRLEFDRLSSLAYWEEVSNADSSETAELARFLIQIDNLSIDEAMNLEDLQKGLYIRYKKYELSDPQINRLFRSLNDLEIIQKVALDLANFYNLNEIYGIAEIYLQKSGKMATNKLILNQHIRNGEFNEVEQILTSGIRLPKDELWYWKARLALWKNDSIEADRLFDIIKNMNPYNENAVIAASEFYRNHEKDLSSYNILIEALLQNQNSVKLLKAYVQACIDAGFISYSLKGLETLENTLDPEEFSKFYRRNEAAIQKLLN